MELAWDPATASHSVVSSKRWESIRDFEPARLAYSSKFFDA